MKNIKKNLDGLISNYLKHFTKKFENFTNQMRIADILLKGFEYRYDKIQGKIGNINDILTTNFENHSKYNNKIAALAGLEVKMSGIEQKLDLINQKIDNLLQEAQIQSIENNKKKLDGSQDNDNSKIKNIESNKLNMDKSLYKQE